MEALQWTFRPDEGRKAAMVSNLPLVLCGESETAPGIKAGAPYQHKLKGQRAA